MVEFSCINQAAVDGLTYTIIAAVDVHADDLADCGEGDLPSLGCSNPLGEDDTDRSDNRAVCNAPRVQEP